MAKTGPEGRQVSKLSSMRRVWTALLSRPARPVLIGGSIILVVVNALVITVILGSYDSIIRDNKRDLATLNTVLTEETSRTLESVKVVIDSVVERVTPEQLESPATFEAAMRDRSVSRMLADRSTGMPHLSSVIVIDADGDIIAISSEDAPVPHLNVADRTYFEALRTDPLVGHFLSEPIVNRITGEVSLAMARRVTGSRGQLLGVVVGVLSVEYFHSLYRQLNIGDGGAITLWTMDGVLVARHPEIEGVGERFKTSLFHEVFPTSSVQTWEVDQAAGGLEPVPRILAVRKVQGYPLAVTTSYNRDTVLVGWRWNALLLVAISALLTVFGLAIMYLIARRLLDYETTTKAISGEHKAVLQQKHLEDQLRQSQKLDALGQLSAGIAHDFNNLLQVIVGNLEIARRRQKAGDLDGASGSFTAAVTAAHKAASLTHPLLVFAKAQPLHPTVISGKQLLSDLSDLLARTLGEHIEVRCVVQDDIWPILADANQLESVLVNLAINARDAMPSGGVLTLSLANISLTGVAGRLRGDFVQFKVADTGMGMAPEIIDRAFEPFFTTKDVGKGSGLGLSQVFGFVDQSGGDVRIDSEIGVGTEVVMFLPRAELAADQESDAVPDQVEDEVTRGEGQTVLVVDDNIALREFASHALREMGYNPVEANDASDAMRAVKTGHIDLMLTDVGLPGLDGPELARHARIVSSELPVIFMTGYPEFDISTDGRLTSGASVLFKPFKHEDLARALSDALHPVT